MWVGEEDLVFTSPTGRRTDPAACRREFDVVAKKAGLDGWTPNELRHSAASLMSDAGMPIEQVADQLGHKDLRMLQRTIATAFDRPSMAAPSSATFSEVDRARLCRLAGASGSGEDCEPGNSGEDTVSRDEGHTDVDGTRRYPQVVCMNAISQGMAGVAAIEPNSRQRREESVADADHRRRRNCRLQSRATR